MGWLAIESLRFFKKFFFTKKYKEICVFWEKYFWNTSGQKINKHLSSVQQSQQVRIYFMFHFYSRVEEREHSKKKLEILQKFQSIVNKENQRKNKDRESHKLWD